MEDDLSLHLQSVWQSPKIGFYCLKAAASAELVEIFLSVSEHSLFNSSVIYFQYNLQNQDTL